MLALLPLTTLGGCGSGSTSNSSQTAEQHSPDAGAAKEPLGLIDLASTTPSRIQVERLTKGLGAAEAVVAPRPLPATAMLMLKHFEGWSAKAYDDSAGYCTIGYGHLISLRRCAATDLGQFASGILPLQGEELLEADTRAARAAVLRRVKTKLKEEQFGALSNFVFNIGEANFSGATMLSLLNLGRPNDAAGQFGRWVKAKGKVQAGLVERRRCEASLFSGLLKLDPKGRFIRSGCAPLAAAAAGGEPIDIESGEKSGQ